MAAACTIRRTSFRNAAVEKLTSILAVVDPADETRHVVAKAMVLARHFRASLELFLCDSENAFSLRHAYDPAGIVEAQQTCLASGKRYLDAIRRSLAEDVSITTHVACASPLYEAIVHRVQESRPDLVIKSAAGHHPLQRFTLDVNDWQLARTCPVPLMLTRGRPWSPEGRFLAAVDVGDTNSSAIARSVMQTAGFLTLGCRGQLDVVYCDPDTQDAEGAARRREALTRLTNEFSVGHGHQHIVTGDADGSLPAFAARQGYDMVVLGALTRRRGLSALVGTLTSRLIDSLDCDFVLVKADNYKTPVTAPLHAVSA
jgi:universal stress protein E